jgi:NAD(P)H dehydrogenase (quinone)
MTILITGTAGKTGKAVLRALTKDGQPVKALVFRPAQIQEVEELGAKDILAGDMRDLDLLKKAMKGVDAVYHICPNVYAHEITIGKKIIAVAASAGVTHFVYHSVLHPQVEAMPHHWKKMRVEERLFKSGLPYTILQPAAYMQNLLANWDTIYKTGKYIVPYAVESRISMVDLEDVALAAALILREASPKKDHPSHLGATYELVGMAAMAQTEVAEALARQLGRPVIAEQQPIDDWEQRARASGMGDYQVNTLVKMFRYYEKYGLSGNPHVLTWLLNRPATSLDDFVARTIENRLPSVQSVRRSYSI